MFKVITPVEVEPLTIAEVRQHLRIPDELPEDDLLLALIQAAREYGEDYTRRAFAPQTLELLLYRFPAAAAVVLPRPPLRAVTWVKYKDSTGQEMTLTGSDYLVDTDSEVGSVVLACGVAWPSFVPYPAVPIRIRYEAGFTVLPHTLRQALLMLIGHWYENREATGTVSGLVAFSVHALLSQYRVECF